MPFILENTEKYLFEIATDPPGFADDEPEMMESINVA